MDIEQIKEKLSSLPSWVWIAGAGIVAIIAFLFLKGGGASSTTTGQGLTSDFTSALSGLSDAITNMGSGGGGTSGGSSGAGAGGGSSSGSSPVDTTNPIATGSPIYGGGGSSTSGSSPMTHTTGSTSSPVTPTPVYTSSQTDSYISKMSEDPEVVSSSSSSSSSSSLSSLTQSFISKMSKDPETPSTSVSTPISYTTTSVGHGGGGSWTPASSISPIASTTISIPNPAFPKITALATTKEVSHYSGKALGGF